MLEAALVGGLTAVVSFFVLRVFVLSDKWGTKTWKETLPDIQPEPIEFTDVVPDPKSGTKNIVSLVIAILLGLLVFSLLI